MALLGPDRKLELPRVVIPERLAALVQLAVLTRPQESMVGVEVEVPDGAGTTYRLKQSTIQGPARCYSRLITLFRRHCRSKPLAGWKLHRSTDLMPGETEPAKSRFWCDKSALPRHEQYAADRRVATTYA